MISSFLFPSSGFPQTLKPDLYILSSSRFDFLNEREVEILEKRFELKLTVSESNFPQLKIIQERNDSVFAVVVSESRVEDEIFLEEAPFFLFSTIYWMAIGTAASLLILYYTRF